MKAIEQYLHAVLFIMLYNEAPTFTSVNESQMCDHSSESYWAVFLTIPWMKPFTKGLFTRREAYP